MLLLVNVQNGKVTLILAMYTDAPGKKGRELVDGFLVGVQGQLVLRNVVVLRVILAIMGAIVLVGVAPLVRHHPHHLHLVTQVVVHLFVVKVMAVEAVVQLLMLIHMEPGVRAAQLVVEEHKIGQMLVEINSGNNVILNPVKVHGGK